jgi:hypothetical protein
VLRQPVIRVVTSGLCCWLAVGGPPSVFTDVKTVPAIVSGPDTRGVAMVQAARVASEEAGAAPF